MDPPGDPDPDRPFTGPAGERVAVVVGTPAGVAAAYRIDRATGRMTPILDGDSPGHALRHLVAEPRPWLPGAMAAIGAGPLD